MYNKAFTQKITYLEYLRYLFPSVVSMIFLSFYTTVDGFFVSRYAGSYALAAINIVIPLTCLFFGISIMIATGSGAVIGIRQGEGRTKEADSFFSFVTAILAVISIVLTVFCYIFLDPILILSGSTETLMEYTRPYGFWTVIMIPGMMFKLYFEFYSRIDGHAGVGMFMSFIGLLFNIILDWFFIAIMDMGIYGAGLGTCIAIYISAVVGLLHFTSKRSRLKFIRPSVELTTFFRSCYNGSSEMMTELSTGITTLLFNLTLLKYAGENGVAAMSILTYFYYFFTSMYFGVTTAGQPIISYNTGARNPNKIHEIVSYSIKTAAIGAIIIFAICQIFSNNLVHIFTTDNVVSEIASNGLRLFSIAFIFCGFGIFFSGYFTAIGNGGLSAIISFCRSFILVIVFLYTLPEILGISGIWLTNPAAELITSVIAIILYFKYNIQKKMIYL